MSVGEESFCPNPVPPYSLDGPISSYIFRRDTTKQKSRRKWHFSCLVPLPSATLSKVMALTLFIGALILGLCALKMGQVRSEQQLEDLLRVTNQLALMTEKTLLPDPNATIRRQHSPAAVQAEDFLKLTFETPVVVETKNMDSDTRIKVFKAAREAFSTQHDFESIAKQIGLTLREKDHHGNWDCVVGTQFGRFATSTVSIGNPVFGFGTGRTSSQIEFLLGNVRVHLLRKY